MASNNHIEGLEELTRQLDNLGKNFPKPKIRKAVNAGMKPTLQTARRLAPGKKIKKGLIKIEEPKFKMMKKKKKVVMRIVFDRGMNAIFQKPIIRPGLHGASPPKPTGYYPISVEYGYKIAGGKREEGIYFVKRAIEMTSRESQEKIVASLGQSIDEITR